MLDQRYDIQLEYLIDIAIIYHTLILEKISNSIMVIWRAISSSSISKKLSEAEKIFFGTYKRYTRRIISVNNSGILYPRCYIIIIIIIIYSQLTCGSGGLSSNIILSAVFVCFVCLDSEF